MGVVADVWIDVEASHVVEVEVCGDIATHSDSLTLVTTCQTKSLARSYAHAKTYA